MNTIKLLFCLIGMLTLPNCGKTDEQKLEELLNSDNLKIQRNTYGGLAGYSEQTFFLTEEMLIVDSESDYQSFVNMDEKKELLKSFIRSAIESNNPNKEMSRSCLIGTDSEYVLESGWTTVTLRPNEKCDSIFNSIVHDKK